MSLSLEGRLILRKRGTFCSQRVCGGLAFATEAYCDFEHLFLPPKARQMREVCGGCCVVTLSQKRQIVSQFFLTATVALAWRKAIILSRQLHNEFLRHLIFFLKLDASYVTHDLQAVKSFMNFLAVKKLMLRKMSFRLQRSKITQL